MTDDSRAGTEPEAAMDADADAEMLEELGDEAPFTSADFHNVVQKQVAHAAFEMLAQAKLPWQLATPFLDAGRSLFADDLREAGRVRLHTVRAEGDSWVDADEAFLGLEIHDRDSGQPWLSETWWLSDIATIDDDPEEVRAIVRALERTIGRLNDWLAEKDGPGGEGETTPPEPKGEGEGEGG
jgi:hypothetical protein